MTWAYSRPPLGNTIGFGDDDQGGPVANPEHKVSMTVYVTKAQLEKLKQLRARTKVPVAEYVREAIDLALKAHATEIPGQLTLLE